MIHLTIGENRKPVAKVVHIDYVRNKILLTDKKFLRTIIHPNQPSISEPAIFAPTKKHLPTFPISLALAPPNAATCTP